MTWTAVAVKDFQDSRRSRSLWFLTALFVLFASVMAWAYAEIQSVGTATSGVESLGLLFFLAGPATLFVSIAAVVVTYKSIAGERESGSVKLLLGLPHSRRDVLLGKVLGRWLTLALSIVVGFTVALGVVFALYAEVSVVDYLLFVGLTVLFALTYVSLIAGLSALTGSTGRAATLGVGAFLVLELLWDVVPLGALYLVNGFQFSTDFSTAPDWVLFLGSITPSSAYVTALSYVLPQSATAAQGIASQAFFLQDWFGLVLLVAWLVVPLSVGYLRFRAADL